ncbi:CNVH-domain-containing protein [Daldinia caldariorum]|uniref:CNVH-domain-containing protein n=1 Tax=Daldinia caldariorum TaxID=326644 RepID=UPI002007BD9E|nr:CNVH-domain-containing protein [Daldinia caldariorum]KAI1468165.1 CNVH-domain-containing protein [Daldinia caldariorum]
MAFSLTSKNIELRGSWLVAEVRKPEDGSWTSSRLNLNEHIGNNDGVFDVTMDRWHNTAQEWSVHLRGPILYARLRTIAGGYAEETSINLDLFVRNRDGNLEFQKLGDSLLLYTAGLTLDNAILRGLAVGRDGKFHVSEIDLDEYFGNIGSKFEIDERHYSRTGRNFRLERESNRLRLFGELQDYEGVHHPAEVDLSACIVNRKGRLSFSKPYVCHYVLKAFTRLVLAPLPSTYLSLCYEFKSSIGSLPFLPSADPTEREHWTTVVAEQIPVFGPSIAGLHRSKDETRTENQSYYEIATSANSASFTVGLAIGAFIGRASESPIIGTILGAALSNASDIFVEDQAVNAIEDPHARSQVQEAKLGSFVSEALRNLIVPEHIAAAAEFLSASFNPEIDVWKNGLAAWLEKQNLNLLADLSLYATMKKVFKQLQGETIEEWQNTLVEIETLKQRSQILELKPEDPPQVIVEEPEEPEIEAIEAPETAAEAEAEASNEAEAPQPDTVSELEAADKVPEINGTEATPTEATATEPAKAVPEAANTASSSTRASSDKSVLKDGAKNASQTNVPGNANTKPSTNPKRWHSVIGIPVWRKSWSRPRQQRVV